MDKDLFVMQCLGLRLDPPVPRGSREDFIRTNIKVIIPVTLDPFQEFLKPFDDAANVSSDVWLLTHQDKLSFEGNRTLTDSLSQRFANLPSECPYIGKSDKDIMSFIKSKNIQTLSELESWINYLEKVSLNSALAAEREAAEQALRETKPDSSDTSQDTDSNSE